MVCSYQLTQAFLTWLRSKQGNRGGLEDARIGIHQPPLSISLKGALLVRRTSQLVWVSSCRPYLGFPDPVNLANMHQRHAFQPPI